MLIFLDVVLILIFFPGNKTYEHFNAMGKFVDKKLQELGGKRVHELGSGDDDANLGIKALLSKWLIILFL